MPVGSPVVIAGMLIGVVAATCVVATAHVTETRSVEEQVVGRELLVLKGHENWVSGVAFSPDGKQVASVSWDKTIRLWDVESGDLQRILPPMKSELSSIAFCPDGSQLAVVGFDYSATLINAKSGRLITSLDGRIAEPVTFSRDGRQIMAACANKERKESVVTAWNTTTGEKLRVLQGHAAEGEYCYTVIWSPDRMQHAVSILDENEKGVRMKVMKSVVDSDEQRELFRLEGSWLPLAFSPDGKWLATITAENSVRLLSTEKGQESRELTSSSADVTSAVFSPDGRWLATASQDTRIRLWDTESGTLRLTLKGHEHLVSCVAFSPDGTRLASSSFDNTVRIWGLNFGP